MLAENSRHDTEDQVMEVSEPETPVEVDERHREERESKPSGGAEAPINHPTDTSNQTSAATESSSKPGSFKRLLNSFVGEPISPLERDNRELQTRLDDLSRILHSRDKEIRQLEGQVERLSKTLNLKEKEHREEMVEKDAELAELKKTLCMYDECSEAEIGDMVDSINTKIQSFTRGLAVKWVREAAKVPDEGGHETTVSDAQVESLKGVIGSQLVNALSDASVGQTKFITIFLQLAWQASIVAVVNKILSCFSASLGPHKEWLQVETALRKVSDAVRRGEVQPAYGRWRLVTHHYLKGVLPGEDVAVQMYVNEALDSCHTATRLAMKSRCPNDESFGNGLQPQTKEIVEAAFKLLTTLQEKMVTTNYEPYILLSGRTFRPGNMIIGKQDREYQRDRVVCTTGLGMLYFRKKGREPSAESPYKYYFKLPQVLTEGNLADMVAG